MIDAALFGLPDPFGFLTTEAVAQSTPHMFGLTSLFGQPCLGQPCFLAQAAESVVAETTLQPAPLIALLAIGIALLLVLILKLKLSAFLALLIVSVLVAATSRLVNPEAVPLTQVADTIVTSMGGALGFIATIIGVGAIFGAILEHSGGTQSLANYLVRKFGAKHAPWAMLLTGFIISVPVFLDVALVILAPLLYALARDTKRPFLHFGLPLVAGLAVTHGFVPPTPGPVAVAYFLGVNLGWVILFGVLVGLPTALICGPPLCILLSKGVELPMPEEEFIEETKVELPSVGFILALIGLPIGMILANTIVEQWYASGLPEGLSRQERGAQLSQLLADSPLPMQLISFFGHPVIALLISTIIALYFLGTRRGVDRETLLDISTKALGPAGIIILITGAGGVFKGVLAATGITDAMEIMFADSGISVLLLAWMFATLIRIAQGSATVAMLTAAGLMGNFTVGMTQPQLALIAVAIAAGATGFSHVNDSGFWMISRYFKMSEGQTLRTWGVISTCISFVGFGIATILWQFFG
ncbi:GntT/GntP/DsdX family permease [Roseiconus lacunae]|uniref:GntP family permease n=1 Tax=Roseiconus lacunae TaxID=2605694 RepID=UPI00193FE937